MYIKIGDKTYDKITGLAFDPAADVTGNEVLINEFSVTVATDDSIDAMQYIRLYDVTGKLWAKYWIVYADRSDKTHVEIKAQSSLKLLERRMLDPVMYDEEPVENIVADLFSELSAGSYSLSSDFAGMTISGFAPDQSCKTRLQWVCFVIGAYIKSFFSDKIEILPVGNVPKLIPMEKTAWKPSLQYGEYRTRISVTAYTYSEDTPGTTDTWVQAGGKTYIQTQLNHGLRNQDLPEGVLVHESHFEGVTIVNDDNVDDILTRLGPHYFKRLMVEMDAVNNGEFLPGERVMFYLDDSTIGEGYIEKADFSFGLQAKSRLTIKSIDIIEAGRLTIVCNYDNAKINRLDYVLPKNYPYEIELPFLEQTWGITRYIFAPENRSTTGTIDEDVKIVEEDYVMALGSNRGTLFISSVDDYSVEGGAVRIT